MSLYELFSKTRENFESNYYRFFTSFSSVIPASSAIIALMLLLSDSVSKVPLVGPSYARRLEKLGIKTVRDLLYYVPFRYDDFSIISKANQLQEGFTGIRIPSLGITDPDAVIDGFSDGPVESLTLT